MAQIFEHPLVKTPLDFKKEGKHLHQTVAFPADQKKKVFVRYKNIGIADCIEINKQKCIKILKLEISIITIILIFFYSCCRELGGLNRKQVFLNYTNNILFIRFYGNENKKYTTIDESIKMWESGEKMQKEIEIMFNCQKKYNLAQNKDNSIFYNVMQCIKENFVQLVETQRTKMIVRGKKVAQKKWFDKNKALKTFQKRCNVYIAFQDILNYGDSSSVNKHKRKIRIQNSARKYIEEKTNDKKTKFFPPMPKHLSSKVC